MRYERELGTETIAHSELLSALFNPLQDYSEWLKHLEDAVEKTEGKVLLSLSQPGIYPLLLKTQKEYGDQLNVFPDLFNSTGNMETTKLLFWIGFEIGNEEMIEGLHDDISTFVAESCHSFNDKSPWAVWVLLEGARFRLAYHGFSEYSDVLAGTVPLQPKKPEFDYFSQEPISDKVHTFFLRKNWQN